MQIQIKIHVNFITSWRQLPVALGYIHVSHVVSDSMIKDSTSSDEDRCSQRFTECNSESQLLQQLVAFQSILSIPTMSNRRAPSSVLYVQVLNIRYVVPEADLRSTSSPVGEGVHCPVQLVQTGRYRSSMSMRRISNSQKTQATSKTSFLVVWTVNTR